MALPSPLYIAFQGIETYFVDKDTGLPLSAGYVEFYSDVARTVPKDVFQQVQLPDLSYSFVNIGSVITLSAVGTFQSPNDGTDIQVYAYPYDADGAIELYYMAVYSSDNVLQFTREAQPPNVAESSNIDLFVGSDNQISNPQFVETLLPESLTNAFTVSGTDTETVFAPDWSVITSGSGTVTITQEPLIDISMPTGAPYAIKISSSGITNLTLRQQITQSPRLLGQGFICGSLVAKSFDAALTPLIMRYTASNGYTVDLVTQSTSADGNYNTLQDNPPSKAISTTNTNSPDAPGYVNIDIVIPVLSTVGITSVQVVSTESANSSTPFIQESTPRQIDHLFHYYKPQLEFKEIPSLLTGWDFALNPAQFGITSFTTTPKYVWDQTIMCSATGTVNVARVDTSGAMINTTTLANEAFYMLQYLSGGEAFLTTLSRLSVNLLAYQLQHTGVIARIYLYHSNTGGSIPALPTTIGTIANTGLFTLTAANWTEIPQLNGAPSVFDFESIDNLRDYQSPFWNGLAFSGQSTSSNFAIVVTFMVPTAGTQVVVNSISCVPGDIPTRPAPQTKDEVLRECQYYYEKSYDVGTAPGTATPIGRRYVLNELGTRFISATSSTDAVYLQSFGLTYDQAKRAIATPVFYSPATITPGFLQLNVLRNSNHVVPAGAGALGASPSDMAIANWGASSQSTKAVVMICTTTSTKVYDSGAGNPGLEGDEAMMLFHYTVDARLGII